MKANSRVILALLVLGPIVAACGGSSTTLGVGGITITSVRNLDTNILNDFGSTPTPFRITGTGYGELEGTEVTVRFWTETLGGPGPAVFEGGSTSMDDVTALITSATTIEGMTPGLSTNCDPLLAGALVDVVVEVILPSGVTGHSVAFADFFALPDIAAGGFSFGGGFAYARACMPTPFALAGTDFPYSGSDGAALITWQATGDNGHTDLFDREPTTAPTTDQTTTTATVTSETSIVGLTPLAALVGTANPETTNIQIVKIEFPDYDLCIDLGAGGPIVPCRGPEITAVDFLDDPYGYADDTMPSTILMDAISGEPEPQPVKFRIRGNDLGPHGETVETSWQPEGGFPDYSQFTDAVLLGNAEFVGGVIGIVGRFFTIGLEPGNSRLTADEACTLRIYWPCGSEVSGYPLTLLAPPTIAPATVENLRPPFDQTNTGVEVDRTWLACIATETEVNGFNFDANVQDLFYDSLHGPAFPIGGGALTDNPAPPFTPVNRTATQITGWSPVDNTITAPTHVTVQVLNPDDGQFDRQGGYWWETTGVLDNVNASRLPFTNSEMQIAINPFNHLNAAICAHDANSGFAAMFHAYTLDGGLTWTQFPVGPSTGPAPDGYLDTDFRFDPMCAFDGFGNYYCVYGVSTAIDGNTYVVAQRSTDGGQSFNLADVSTIFFPISSGLDRWTCATGPELAFNFTPQGQALWIGLVDFGTGDLWLSGLATQPGPGPNGEGGPIFLYNNVPVNDFPVIPGFDFYQHCSPTVGPTGETYITFIEGFAPFGFLTAPPTFIWESTWQFPLGFDGVDNFVAQTNNAAARVPIPPQFGRGKGVIPISNVIQNGPHAGRVVIVWTDATFDGFGTLNGLNVLSQYSDDDGLNWSPPVPVHGVNFSYHFMPWISADRTRDQIYVGYYDTTRDTVTPNQAVEWYVVGSNDGVNWSNPLLLAQAPSDAGLTGLNDMLEYNGIDALGGCLYCAWADNANFTGDNPDGTLTPDGFDVLTSVFMLDTD